MSAATNLEFAYALNGAQDFDSNKYTITVDSAELVTAQSGVFGPRSVG